ncbi:MAG: endonuclease MutS2 [Deltaproteobacteria bacterium]|nr:endonuclease MutS2 [Deltaproteobacteria bacterium]
MPEHTLTALEFPGLLEVVARYAVSTLGRGFLTRLKPIGNFTGIRAKFQEIREMRELWDREGPPPLTDFPDLASWLAKAAVPGSLLPPEAFNDILAVLRLSRNLRGYLAKGGEHTPHLAALAARLHELPDLRRAITRSISPHNFILDEASPELARLRRDLAAARERLNRFIRHTFFAPAYQNAIQSPIISQRHGRYVIPLKADHKGAIPGIIHDTSQTRATIYVEPLAIVEMNNTLNLLSNQEKREEEAVLRRLTDQVRQALPELKESLDTLAELDAVAAKVRYAEEFQAREPILTTSGGVEFREARHPLLLARYREKSQPVVPIDLKLTEAERFLIISGANAGGKTVALKTLGLLSLMIQSGIPVPVAEGSRFTPFDRIFADIGDPQDLEHDLSTFSAHLQRALEMLAHLPPRALVLLDELGTATDPTEGGALALALLKAFHRCGAFGAVTTHLPLIKGFAAREPGFQNAAVIFDEDTKRPTYRLAYGLAGASNALAIARELGLSPEILSEAESFLDAEELKAYRLLAEVESAREQLTRREAELEARRQELENLAQEVAAQRQAVYEERQRLMQEARSQAQARIREAEAEFKRILGRLRRQEESWGRLRQELSERARELIRSLEPEPLPEVGPMPELKPGQKVYLPALGLTGEVLNPPREGKLAVRVRKVKLMVRPEEAMPAAEVAEAGAPAPRAVFYPAAEQLPSLNVVGLRVDEALPLVDRLLDQAILQGAERVDIIHGVGTGRLKQAVWEHLRHHAMVKAIHGADNPGVTVVDLKS